MSTDPQTFKKNRLHRIFREDGRTLVVAMDHLSRLGRDVRIRHPQRIIRELVAGNTDAVLVRPAIARRCAADLGRTGVVLSIGADTSCAEWGVEYALRLGADAIKVEVFPGSTTAPDPRIMLGKLVSRCENWSMPLLAEMIPVSFADKDAHTAQHIADVARLGADLGVDVVKTKYTGDIESFAEVVELAGAPVVILGGSDGDLPSLFNSVRQALDAGAAGAAVGRRIWSSERPGHIAGALSRLIHEDISVEQAVAEAGRTVTGPG